MSLLSSIVLTDSRQKVLGLLLLHPDRSYHVREIARLTGTSAGSLHRELAKLAEAKILSRETVGRHVYYQANQQCIIYEELASILKKSSGLVDVLIGTLVPMAAKIELAFVFGSLAKGSENMGSDVDLLIVGELSFADVVQAVYPIQAVLGREINPKVYSKQEWKKMLENQDDFIKNILKNKKLFIIGSENELR